MKQPFLKAYESPKAEVIEIEPQGVLCVSEASSSRGGFQFTSTGDDGSW